MKIGTLISMLSASTQKFSISMQRLLKTARRDGKRIKSILSRFPKMDFLACTLSCPQAHTAKRTSEDTNLAQNALQPEWGNFPFAIWNGICWGLPLQLVNLIKVHFLPHLESFILERKFEKVLYNTLMGCSSFPSYHCQMGVTIMGFAEHFGSYLFSRAQINFNFFRHYERHVMLAISKEPTDYFGYQDELRHLIGYNCSSSSNPIDCCPRILGAGMKILISKTITNSLL